MRNRRQRRKKESSIKSRRPCLARARDVARLKGSSGLPLGRLMLPFFRGWRVQALPCTRLAYGRPGRAGDVAMKRKIEARRRRPSDAFRTSCSAFTFANFFTFRTKGQGRNAVCEELQFARVNAPGLRGSCYLNNSISINDVVSLRPVEPRCLEIPGASLQVFGTWSDYRLFMKKFLNG